MCGRAIGHDWQTPICDLRWITNPEVPSEHPFRPWRRPVARIEELLKRNGVVTFHEVEPRDSDRISLRSDVRIIPVRGVRHRALEPRVGHAMYQQLHVLTIGELYELPAFPKEWRQTVDRIAPGQMSQLVRTLQELGTPRLLGENGPPQWIQNWNFGRQGGPAIDGR